jgi:hypothetical protein
MRHHSLVLLLVLVGLVGSVGQPATAAPKKPTPPVMPAGYTVQSVEIPKDVVLGASGLAFDREGSLLICTREGEVWRLHVHNDDPFAETVKGHWTLYADGLHEPLGIHVDQKNGDIFVVQRGELTQLIDENKDGAADFYKQINAGWGLTDNYHEYAFGPVRGKDGSFYGTLNTSLSWPQWARSKKWDIARVHGGAMGRATEYRGWSFRVTPEGKFEPWSAGLRSPAGIGMSPQGDIFFTDNQGDWNASSALHHIVKGRFHGHPSSLFDHPKYKGKDLNSFPIKHYDELRKRPAVWFPHGAVANSPGEPTWDTTKGKFGPFAGQIFCGDQGRSNVFRIVLDKVDGEFQGACIKFADNLESGVIRNAFASDGSLWIGQTGRGWGSHGGKEFGLKRIAYNPKIVPSEIQTITLTSAGFRIGFTKPIDKALATKLENYDIRHWGYHYHGKYGSPKVDDKAEKVTEAKIIDAKTIEIKVNLVTKTVYQVKLDKIKFADGSTLGNPIAWYTLNRTR